MKRSATLAIFAMTVTTLVSAQQLTVTTKDGASTDVAFSNGTLKKRVLVLDSGERMGYDRISEIATADFDAYERAVKRTSRPENQHVTVKWTGTGNIDQLRLQKLEKKRQGAGAARGAGGLMMLFGALAGNRDIYAAGLATYGVGTIVKDVNTDKMLRVQTNAIANLQAEQQALKKADSLEAQYRIEYGDENVDGLIALIDGNHKRALAFADAAETSNDANVRWSAVWLKAIIYADQDDRAAVEKEYDRLIVLDPEVSSYADADHWMDLLLKDLNEMRNG